MSNVDKAAQKAFVLWLNGVGLRDIRALPEVESLLGQSVQVELESSPITGPQSHLYQILGGRLPASFGFFDTLMPLGHLARSSRGASGYTIVEEQAGRDAAPKFFPAILREKGWNVQYIEGSLPECAASARDLPVENNQPAGVIMKCDLGEHPLTPSLLESLTALLQAARSWVGDDGLLALLAGVQPAPVRRFVNLNNFLADMGLLEWDAGSRQINWQNSLAYFAGHGQLWINQLGREPQGVVHPQDEYDEVCDSLVQALPVKVRDPETGLPVIERVFRKEELYSGNYLFCAPDLVVLFKPGHAPSARSTHLDFDDAVVTGAADGTTAVAGVHPGQLTSYLLASSPALASGVTAAERAALTAIVPTLLHALGIEGGEFESQPIEQFFSTSYLQAHPIRSRAESEELSEEDEELVIGRLRDLGYI